MVKILKLPELCTDAELKTIKGEFIDEEWIHHIINEDCDIFDDNDKFILSFRKKKLKNVKVGWDNYHKMASASRGRGASAGPVDPNNAYWKKRTLIKTSGYSTSYLVNGKPSKMRVNNHVFSNPIGYYDKTKNMGNNLPCRLTSFTQKHIDKFNAGLPYLQEIAECYCELNPDAYHKQLDRAKLKPEFKITDTPFSTITINRNFRTALHQDAGDFGGVACLSVLEEGQYNGGLFTIPRFGIGVNLREGDILIADVHQYHSNTELWTTTSQDEYNIKNGKTIKENIAVGTAGIDYNFTRISFVCYLREKMINC